MFGEWFKFLSRPHRHIVVFSFLASLSLPLAPLSSACRHQRVPFHSTTPTRTLVVISSARLATGVVHSSVRPFVLSHLVPLMPLPSPRVRHPVSSRPSSPSFLVPLPCYVSRRRRFPDPVPLLVCLVSSFRPFFLSRPFPPLVPSRPFVPCSLAPSHLASSLPLVPHLVRLVFSFARLVFSFARLVFSSARLVFSFARLVFSFAHPVARSLVPLLVCSSCCSFARPVLSFSHSLVPLFLVVLVHRVPPSSHPGCSLSPTLLVLPSLSLPLVSPPLVSSLVSSLSSSPSRSSPHLVQSCMTSWPQRPLSFLPPQIVTHSHPFLVVLGHLISPVVSLLLFACLARLLPCPLSVVLFRPVPCCPLCSLYCHTMSIDCLAMNKE